jgi:hypothetical protein
MSNFLREIVAMKKYFYTVLLGAVLLISIANAQAQNLTSENSPVKLARVDDAQIPTLRNLQKHSKSVIYLSADAAALQKDPAALSALQDWIKNGGVMAVCSDAATLFGFQLQTARPGSPQKGGQLFGRAVAAAPFGSEPLTWNISAPANSAAVLDFSNATAFGGMTVFYQMQKGDPLLVSHPSAVPLLRVTDLADPQTNLQASAMTSYGNGWIIFVPRQVEMTRTQGNQFFNNLLNMGANPPLPVDISAITAMADSLSGNAPDYKPLLTQLQKRLNGKEIPADAAMLMPRTLAVARPLAQAMLRALQTANSPRAQKRVNAAIDLWLLQAELQRANSATAIAAAFKLLDLASQNAPRSREVLFWKGAAAVQNAESAALPASRHAKYLNDAATDWTAAATAQPLLATAASPLDSFGDISPTILTFWSKQAHLASAVAAGEPPAITLIGQGDKAIVLRHSSNDPSLRLALPSIRKFPSLSTEFGWFVPGEEVLIFPNETALTNYTANLGTAANGETPFGRYGNVLEDHLLTVSQPSEPVIVPGTPRRVIQTGAKRRVVLPGTKDRIIQTSTGAAAILGRMHAEALINVLDEDGNKIPAWMQLGMMALGDDAVIGDTQPPTQELLQAGAANNLLSAGQFDAINQNKAGLANDEALSLMTYFYQDFGPGSVMETIQRIASGQTADAALNATVGMNEDQFFRSWFDALSGSRRQNPAPRPRAAKRKTKRRGKITNQPVSRAVITHF